MDYLAQAILAVIPIFYYFYKRRLSEPDPEYSPFSAFSSPELQPSSASSRKKSRVSRLKPRHFQFSARQPLARRLFPDEEQEE
jgi:hypothetical protein